MTTPTLPNDIEECSICGKKFTGEDAKMRAFNCSNNHNRYFISIWDFEVSQVVSALRTGNMDLLPKSFIKSVSKLVPTALRGR